jgi:hypothetical protein
MPFEDVINLQGAWVKKKDRTTRVFVYRFGECLPKPLRGLDGEDFDLACQVTVEDHVEATETFVALFKKSSDKKEALVKVISIFIE